MSILKNTLTRMGVLASGPAAAQKSVGDIFNVRITVETPEPLHGIGFELHWSENLTPAGELAWGEFLAGGDDAENMVDGHLYFERALPPTASPQPAGSFVICEIPFRCDASGFAEISIAELLATRYAADLSIMELVSESVPATLEVVMAQTGSKVIVRVEIL